MRIGLFSQRYEPEPPTIPHVLASELNRRGHSVGVLTGFPNYPEWRLFKGYLIAWRADSLVSGVPVRRVALFPSHSSSYVGRLANDSKRFSWASTARATVESHLRALDRDPTPYRA